MVEMYENPICNFFGNTVCLLHRFSKGMSVSKSGRIRRDMEQKFAFGHCCMTRLLGVVWRQSNRVEWCVGELCSCVVQITHADSFHNYALIIRECDAEASVS